MAKNNNNEIQQNKDNMLSMIAITEDITRTTNRLYQFLYNLMSNPGDIEDIKTSIDDLTNKIKTLKDVSIGTPLIEEDNVIVPGPNDVSPEVDTNYVPPVVRTKTKPPQKKLTTKRPPNKSSKVKKPLQKMQKKTFSRKPYNKEQPLPDTTD